MVIRNYCYVVICSVTANIYNRVCYTNSMFWGYQVLVATLPFHNKVMLSKLSYQVNRQDFVLEVGTVHRHLVREELSRGWLGAQLLTDITGSRNKHCYNMAIV